MYPTYLAIQRVHRLDRAVSLFEVNETIVFDFLHFLNLAVGLKGFLDLFL